MLFSIREPIWKTKSVGLNVYKLKCCDEDEVDVEILYENKYGERVYPGTYHINRKKALEYPTQVLKSKVVVSLIPIKDLAR